MRLGRDTAILVVAVLVVRLLVGSKVAVCAMMAVCVVGAVGAGSTTADFKRELSIGNVGVRDV